IGARQAAYSTLRDSIAGAFRAPFELFRSNGDSEKTIWALKDVSFDVLPGEIVGVIGRNGAGKSTLLKILSRITEPTTGQVDLFGRVGSLLEVGTGFHPELSGRENIYLNGAILGMRRSEIDKKFDEIVSFAEIESFIDTPVKHYSSGMYMRLAFAVAAHLEPEILIVDEVLAVGDITFQRKCLNKMKEVGDQGRTVIFVSHNIQAVTRLCQNVVLIEAGQVTKNGPAREVISSYIIANLRTTAEREWKKLEDAPGNEIVRLRNVRVCEANQESAENFDIRESIGIEIIYDVLKSGEVLVPNYHFFNEEGVCAFVVHDWDGEWRTKPRPQGRYISTAWVPGNFLAEGTFLVGVAISSYQPFNVHFYEQNT
ncbi:MAG: ABC transporter ATP-binding protein, partial [Anaerolineae bacterium]|nr:ABC transporter ATP-binding protein [Anaerolineae bacterium]